MKKTQLAFAAASLGMLVLSNNVAAQNTLTIDFGLCADKPEFVDTSMIPNVKPSDAFMLGTRGFFGDHVQFDQYSSSDNRFVVIKPSNLKNANPAMVDNEKSKACRLTEQTFQQVKKKFDL